MIPSQNEMFQLVLSAVASLPQFTRRQVKQIVAEKLHLTEQEKMRKPVAVRWFMRVVRAGQFRG